MNGFSVHANSDDESDKMIVITSGKFLNVLRDRLNYAPNVLDEWCSKSTLSVNLDKMSTMIFTTKNKVTQLGKLMPRCGPVDEPGQKLGLYP